MIESEVFIHLFENLGFYYFDLSFCVWIKALYAAIEQNMVNISMPDTARTRAIALSL